MAGALDALVKKLNLTMRHWYSCSSSG